jgi:hypothetical protein
MGGDEVDAGLRTAALAIEHVARGTEARCDCRGRPFTAPEVTHRVAILIIPFRPPRRTRRPDSRPDVDAKRLTTAWECVGTGIGPATQDIGSPRVTRSTAPTEPPGHKALLRQVELQRELEHVCGRLQGTGVVWQCLKAIVLQGASPASWAASMRMEPKTANGILLASLSSLAAAYSDLDPATPAARTGRLRTWVTRAQLPSALRP